MTTTAGSRVATFDEVIELAQRLGTERGRPVGIYPETKHPSYFRSIGLPLEEQLLASLEKHGWNRADAPVFIQSFETGNLRELRKKTHGAADPAASATAKPFDDDGLKAIAGYADGIGPEKRLLVPVSRGRLAGPATDLVERAHRAGLLVHVWTVRTEKEFLPAGYKGDAGRSSCSSGSLASTGCSPTSPTSERRRSAGRSRGARSPNQRHCVAGAVDDPLGELK